MTTSIAYNNNYQATRFNNTTQTQNLNFSTNFNWSDTQSLLSSPNQHLQVVLLVMQLLQQLMQQLNQPIAEQAAMSTANTLNLNPAEQSILTSRFADTKSQVLVLDGTNQDGKISIGDTLVVQSSSGQELKRSTLTKDDLYELRFRENMLKNGLAIETGWEFTDQLVSIKEGTLAEPEIRSFTGANGQTGHERVLERNQFWEVVERDESRYLLMRTANDQGQTVQASDALNDIFTHRDSYAFDCASPMSLLNLKSSLDTIGPDDFNQHAGQLLLSSWFDQYDSSNFDGGYLSTVRTAEAGVITINGIHNLAGETALFDPSKGDCLIAGNAYYFDLPGDTSSSAQGWNALYLGQNEDGSHNFWSNSIGPITVDFTENSYLTSGFLTGYYLGAVVSDPNTARLQAWDSDQSVVS